MDAYIYQADIYCEDCAENIKCMEITGTAKEINELWKTGDSVFYPQGPFPNGGGKADYPQHCGSCGTFLENPLTDDGYAYVQTICNYAAKAKHYKIMKLWPAFYNIKPQ